MMLVACECSKKGTSVGSVLRCASAFGATQLLIVGSPKFGTHGAHGAQNYIPIVHFYYWSECVEYVRERGCSLVAVTPFALRPDTAEAGGPTSLSVDTFSFSKNTCFLIGDKDGCTAGQLAIADEILHVESPNLAYNSFVRYDAKISVCFQRFCIDMASASSEHHGEKHLLGAPAAGQYIQLKRVLYSKAKYAEEATIGDEGLGLLDDDALAGMFGDGG